MPRKQKTPATKPVKLQVNLAGAWKDIAYFDANDDEQSNEVIDGATKIGEATHTPFRIVTRDGMQTVLTHFTSDKGWRDWRKAA